MKIFRILDANANRAREGLRVVEEICRFALENKTLTNSIKKLRAELVKDIRLLGDQGLGDRDIRVSGKMLAARKALSDVGAKLYTKSESKRRNICDVFHSNIKRVEEAVRVLEEFSKLIDPNSGRRFKAIRMKVYQIEKRVALKLERAGL